MQNPWLDKQLTIRISIFYSFNICIIDSYRRVIAISGLSWPMLTKAKFVHKRYNIVANLLLLCYNIPIKSMGVKGGYCGIQR